MRSRTIGISGDTIVPALGALLPIMNPFSTAPLLASLTASADRTTRNHQALMACIYAGGILVIFLLLGGAIIEFFGISIRGFALQED